MKTGFGERGGLRIGKLLPERRLDEPFDDQLEWERDATPPVLARWYNFCSFSASESSEEKRRPLHSLLRDVGAIV